MPEADNIDWMHKKTHQLIEVKNIKIKFREIKKIDKWIQIQLTSAS